jgi:ABC-type multidrug transport system ATPase subunit
VHTGEILAIMGPSGAGKSSLLSILSQQPQLLPKMCTPHGRIGIIAQSPNGPPAVTPEHSNESEEIPSTYPSPLEAPNMRILGKGNDDAGVVNLHTAARGGGAALGFVQQHDCLMPTLTVTETVLLGMMFRKFVRGKQVEQAGSFVHALLGDLGLLGTQHRCARDFPTRLHLAHRVCTQQHKRGSPSRPR